jgi:hypothetical protein
MLVYLSVAAALASLAPPASAGGPWCGRPAILSRIVARTGLGTPQQACCQPCSGATPAVQEAILPPTSDETWMFDEMYSDLGLEEHELAALRTHWESISGRARLEHYLHFFARAAAIGQEAMNEAQSSGPPGQAKTYLVSPADEKMFQDMYAGPGLSPSELAAIQSHWKHMTPAQRQTAFEWFRKTMRPTAVKQ